MVLINNVLSNDMIEELAGYDAVRFCAEQDTYLLRDAAESKPMRTFIFILYLMRLEKNALRKSIKEE